MINSKATVITCGTTAPEHDKSWTLLQFCSNMMRSRKLSYFAGGAIFLLLVFGFLSQHSSPNYENYTAPVEIPNAPSYRIEPQQHSIQRNLESLETPEPTVTPVKLCDLIGCHDRAVTQRYGQRGDYWVLHNYIPARKWFGCADSITYTTHGDHTFLDNLETLLVRWNGPISISIFAPGTDFDISLQSIQYVRNCGPNSKLIQDLVTFHMYFPNKHVPKNIPKVNGTSHLNNIKVDCNVEPPWTKKFQSYKTTHKILYPVNVGRNVAKDEAVTHFVLASDIELYPNPGLIPKFLKMVKAEMEKPELAKNSTVRKVYPLSIFEIKENMKLPNNKTQLVAMLKKGDAVPFHKFVCPNCHKVPKADEWILMAEEPGLNVSHVGKRTGTFLHWEPIYIGTHAEPPYDERLSWEGKSDKMTQGYAMCVLDYEFHILDNAFLVHRPGIKRNHKDKERDVHVKRTQLIIRQQILPEMKLLYGTHKGCTV